MPRAAAALLAAVVLLASFTPAQPTLKIAEIELGHLRGGVFEPNPSRVFSAGEPVALRVTLSVPAALPVRFEAKLVHPLGPVIKAVSQNLEPLPRGGEWVLTAVLDLSGLPEGYYRLALAAEAGGSRVEDSVVFYYRGLVALRNVVEALYEVRVEGEGDLETLIVALPNDPLTRLVGEPLITPRPSAVLRDGLGNAYALYRNVKVRGVFRVVVGFTAVQELTYVSADAPLSEPPPAEVRAFLEPAPLIESNHPDIVSLARRLTAGASTYREALSRIADFTSSTIKYDEAVASLPNYNQLGALWTLSARRGACLQFARLFTALARAAGIPARVVTGLSVKPPGVEGEAITHAFVEAYIPGYGWLPVEPQQRGSMLGLAPPAPGYIALVRGSGERTELAGAEREAVPFLLVYTGFLRASFNYTGRIYPASQPPAALQLHVQVPQRAFFGDKLKVQLPQLPGGICEIAVRAPSFTSTAKASCGGLFELELNETGSWLIELFAWAPGYLPAHASAEVLVEPKPLKLFLSIADSALFRSAEITAVTQPPVPRAEIRFTVKTCYYSEKLAAVTDEHGVAVVRTGPLLLPCQLEVSASTAPRGYAEATSSLETSVEVPAELYLVAAAALIAAALANVRRKPRAGLHPAVPAG